MPSLTPRENYLRALRHQDVEYMPAAYATDIARVGLVCPSEKGTVENGQVDGFGVRWVASDSAIGGLIPEPGVFILKDVTRWKKDVTLPNVNDHNWQQLADADYAAGNIDRNQVVVGFLATCGVWERIAALMGFEEAMVAMVEEPEACHELFAAITDYKIALAEKVAKYYKADTYTNFDDIATERNLFISPDTYRTMIMPHHARLHAAVRGMGMIPIQHICGKAEPLIREYIKSGAESWNAVQPTNDLKSLLDKYGDMFCFEGGFDSTGKPGRPTATLEEVVADGERCFREYGSKKGYIYSGGPLNSLGDTQNAQKIAALQETINRLRFAGK